MNPADTDPESVLTAEGQWTEPWGGSEDGCPCDKCDGAGTTGYECWSCLLTEPNPSCPVCGGRVRFEAECPVCRGTGRIDGKPRHGVSVFPTAEALYHYMIDREADLDSCVILELEADRADDVDFDADQGTMLVIPHEICGCRNVERDLVERVQASTASVTGER